MCQPVRSVTGVAIIAQEVDYDLEEYKNGDSCVRGSGCTYLWADECMYLARK